MTEQKPSRLQDMMDSLEFEVQGYYEFRALPTEDRRQVLDRIKRLRLYLAMMLPQGWEEGR
jgi:hypothetical protein